MAGGQHRPVFLTANYFPGQVIWMEEKTPASPQPREHSLSQDSGVEDTDSQDTGVTADILVLLSSCLKIFLHHNFHYIVTYYVKVDSKSKDHNRNIIQLCACLVWYIECSLEFIQHFNWSRTKVQFGSSNIVWSFSVGQ